jgi:cobyrinic acid a,c-diamide synthase
MAADRDKSEGLASLVQAPRLVIAGLSGDSGKTFVAMGLLASWRDEGHAVAAFKKGPDYIDAAWLSRAAGSPCRNLDTYLCPADEVRASFCRHAAEELSVIEGNRGLLDGLDLAGTHSTAALARLIDAPVILMVGAGKVTRTVAAGVAGCRALEPEVKLCGVLLNGVASARHETMARRAVEELAGVPVLGALPRLGEELLPDRHLGLVPPEESAARADDVAGRLGRFVSAHVDRARLLAIARVAAPLPAPPPLAEPRPTQARIGVFRDSAFTFYYPENLEALARAGAELVSVSALADRELPAVDALYLGGGFPETHAARLAANTDLQREVRDAAERGLPIYAECGGLIYLSRSLRCGDESHAMAGVLPIELQLETRPQGHGYVEAAVDGENPFFATGTTLRGHEFHYTRVSSGATELRTVLRLPRGTGCGEGRDGIVHRNVFASYTHLHALGAPQWATALVRRAAEHRLDGLR